MSTRLRATEELQLARSPDDCWGLMETAACLQSSSCRKHKHQQRDASPAPSCCWMFNTVLEFTI